MNNQKVKHKRTLAVLATALLMATLCCCNKGNKEEPTPAPNNEATKALETTATPAPTPEATPAPTPEATPAPTEAPTPEATPAPTEAPVPTTPLDKEKAEKFARAKRLNAYANTLTDMGQGGMFPCIEDESYSWLAEYFTVTDDPCSFLCESVQEELGEDAYNHFLIRDFDGDEKEELIIVVNTPLASEVTCGVYCYTYNEETDKVEVFPMNDELVDMEMTGLLFEESRDNPIAYEIYSCFTWEYINLCLEEGFAAPLPRGAIDIGAYYVYPQMKTLEVFMAECGLSEDNYNGEDMDPDFYAYYATDDGELIVLDEYLGYGYLHYTGYLDFMYMFRLQPGMHCDEVQEAMDMFHAEFTGSTEYDGTTVYYYEIGSDAWSYCISVFCDEAGYIEDISIGQGRAFAG